MGWSNFTSKCYYRGENSNIEEKIEISIIEEEIEVGWSNFTSKYYYRGENSNELEMF